MNFIAIDFETANSIRSGICSIGLAVVDIGSAMPCPTLEMTIKQGNFK